MSKLTSIIEVELGQTKMHEQVSACVLGAWRSLVVVPTEPGSSALRLAEALVERCNLIHANRAKLFSAEHLTHGAIANLISDVSGVVQSGGRAVIAIDAISARRSGAPLMLIADAALLCVQLGRTTTKNALKTLKFAGRDRFIGAVTIDADADGAS